MITDTPAATWLRDDGNGETVPLLYLADACLSDQEKEALNDLSLRAYEGGDFFYIGAFDAWFSVSEAGTDRAVISLLKALDQSVLAAFAVDREWSRAALAAGCVILADPPAGGEAIPAIQGTSVACVAAGDTPR